MNRKVEIHYTNHQGVRKVVEVSGSSGIALKHCKMYSEKKFKDIHLYIHQLDINGKLFESSSVYSYNSGFLCKIDVFNFTYNELKLLKQVITNIALPEGEEFKALFNKIKAYTK